MEKVGLILVEEVDFGFSEPEGALWRALALQDSGRGFEPPEAEGVIGRKEREHFCIEGAERGWGVEGEGVEGPVLLLEERGEEGLAVAEA